MRPALPPATDPQHLAVVSDANNLSTTQQSQNCPQLSQYPTMQSMPTGPQFPPFNPQVPQTPNNSPIINGQSHPSHPTLLMLRSEHSEPPIILRSDQEVSSTSSLNRPISSIEESKRIHSPHTTHFTFQ